MKKALVLGLVVLALFSSSDARVRAAQGTGGNVSIASTAPGTTQVTISLTDSGTYSATLNADHCGQAGKLRYTLNPLTGGSSVTTLKVSYRTVVAGDWNVTLVPKTGTGAGFCSDSLDSGSMVTDSGMPGTDAPLKSLSTVKVLPATGNGDQTDIVALLALALAVLTLGVSLTRRKPLQGSVGHR
ncbi:MAG: LPXTG cell wall anchor domain-containing protein [Chloroflexota bacterium]